MFSYNSRNMFYKSPFGATKTGETVQFKISCEPHITTPVLIINQPQGQSYTVPMTFFESFQGNSIFTANFTPIHSGLYFYCFELMHNNLKILPSTHGDGVVKEDGNWFQLTVYEDDFITPEYVKGSTFYQIFPDRFYNPPTENLTNFKDRIYRRDFDNPPYWQPDLINKDYYGGTLNGIIEKLDYIKSLNIDYIYLNPIFEAHANHRYNTADYMKVDPDLGTIENFENLCRKAAEKDIGIILDGVFSHTGSDSIYFNKEHRYKIKGAFDNLDSPYRSWFDFDQRYHHGYRCWWDFETLPEVNEYDQSFIDYICGENGVIHYWLSKGAAGFRLDVADELPDDFICKIRKAVKSFSQEKLLIGEVWEDATNKISFDKYRTYLFGNGLDSTMNYPFREAVINFIRNGNGNNFCESIMTIYENYPKPAIDTALNSLSTHDTPRLITALVSESPYSNDRKWQSAQTLSSQQLEHGKKLSLCAYALLYGLPGVPCLYYGDEVALTGYRDPFNRSYFPWNNSETVFTKTIANFGKFRKENSVLKDGYIYFVHSDNDCVAFLRFNLTDKVLVTVNRGDTEKTIIVEDKNYNIPPYSFLNIKL